jgi:hypothetical protein
VLAGLFRGVATVAQRVQGERAPVDAAQRARDVLPDRVLVLGPHGHAREVHVFPASLAAVGEFLRGLVSILGSGIFLRVKQILKAYGAVVAGFDGTPVRL